MISEIMIDSVISEMAGGFKVNSECFSKTRDIFTARLQSYIIENKKYLEAVKIAFTKRISGRSPEQRGNGLKFVSETIQQNNWYLYFQSGSGSCLIDGKKVNFIEKSPTITGCLAILNFNGAT